MNKEDKKDFGKELMDHIIEKGATLLINLEDKFILYRYSEMIYRFTWDEEQQHFRGSCADSITKMIDLLHIGEDFIRKTAMKEIIITPKGSQTIERKSDDN